MAASGNPQTPGSGKKELSMEIRLLIAFALMGLVMFGWSALFPPPRPQPQPPQAKKEAPAAQPAAATPAASAPAPAAPAAKPGRKTAAPASPAAVPAVAADKEAAYTVETDLYKVAFTNRGAAVKSWILKKYTDNAGRPIDVISADAAKKIGFPFAFVFSGQRPSADLGQALYAVTQPDPLTVEFAFSDGRTSAKKSFRFLQKTYKTQISTEVLEGSTPVPHLLAWRGGFGDRTAHNAAALQRTVHFDLASNKLATSAAGDAKDGVQTVTGGFQFAGIEDAYFAAVFLGAPGAPVTKQTWSDPVAGLPGGAEEPHVGVAVGGEGRLAATLFLGPKDLDVLRSTEPQLEKMVDFGTWFGWMAKPLFLALHWTHDNLISNWGWAIVFVTVIINLLMIPLRFSNLRSMQKMQAIKPEIDKINEKYKKVAMRDPRRQEQNQEIMALYQKHGVSPVGGCLPMLLQMPFFIAFYTVLTVVIEMRGANWLWVPDLSQPEPMFIRILPLAMIATQFVMQKMTPSTPGVDPTQQRMMMFMPLIFGVMFYAASSGLVLYWLTGNVVGIVQQYFFNRVANKPAPAAAARRKS